MTSTRPLTADELAYAKTLPPGVVYIPTQDGGHNSREANEAYRRASDATNARWRALCAADAAKATGGAL